ncbi:MAG: Do family serine endopeptidase [Gammaproteobacteria bacterium]|nr:Do family serine endopeptidase [Gammaproteobacteria bacterium]
MNKRIIKRLGWAALLLTSAGWCALPVAVPTQGELPSLANMLEKVNPAVVNIATYTTIRSSNPLLDDPFFRRFFNVPQNQTRRTQSAGSGVIVDAEQGYIVTNNHVVGSADEITVGLADGRALQAKLVGRDQQVDLAVLRVEPEALSEINLANSATLRVGDFVVAIGNPFGLNQTVTSGIVSALGRSGLGIEGYEDFIQTDAPINPGNSGGALVDLRGDLVGINTAILAPAGSNVGIGFAIPSNMVRAIMDELIEKGEVRRGLIGVTVQSLNVDLANAFNVDRRDGVVVVDVEPDSPAARAGLQAGDIISKVGDRKIEKISDFHSQAAVMFIGDDVDIEVIREGRKQNVEMFIEENTQQQAEGRRIDVRLTGVELENFRNADEAGTSAGVLITDVDRRSKAYAYGLRAGDVIVGVNRRTIRDIGELRDGVLLDQRRIVLRVYRNGSFGNVVIR